MENLFLDIFASFLKVFFYILKAFSPLFIGMALAYLLNGPVEWVRVKIAREDQQLLMSKSPKRRGLAIFITYLLVSIILVSVIFAFITLMLGAFPSGGLSSVTNDIYEYFNSYYESVLDFASVYLPDDIARGSFNLKDFFITRLQDMFSFEKIVSIFSNLAGGIVNLALGVVASIYLLKDKEFFLSLWQKLLSLVFKQKTHGIINEIFYEINLVLTTFIRGALVDSILVALLSSVVLSILNIKFAVIMGIIGGLVNVIPYFGPFLGMIPAFLISFATQGPLKAVLAVISLFLVQQLDSNYIYPKIVGTSTGLHPLFILLSVSVTGYFGGVPGMLLAVPMAGIIQALIKKWVYSI